MNIKRIKGDAGEELAAKWLKRRRYQIIERNFSCRWGEIDVIAQKGDLLCFVEVKTRAADSFGRPAEAVDYRKQQKIVRTAEWYLRQRHEEMCPCRFDVLEVYPQGNTCRIRHIEGAFEA